ncbi:MAG: tyrosine-protein phosphatase [Firmicutes bacterium]|nr:tyrosine-protein phosphatase [Bacillota bacterium]
MNKKRKAIIFMIMALSICLAFSACGKKEPEAAEPKIEGCAIQHEEEFGGVYIETTIDDFNALGFEYGDSVKVVFSNGYTLEDVPYYNGYYVDAGQPLLIAYPGYDYIKACVNYGEDLWDTGGLYAAPGMRLYSAAGLDEHCTASVYLNEHGKYIDTQTARDIHYYDERDKYPSDAVFANFRNIKVGNIKENTLYRSASPCDNQHNRASYVDALISEAGVRFILNLSDNDAKIEKYMKADDFDSPYFKSLYEEGNVIPLSMTMNFASDDFKEKIAKGFAEMAEKDGPYLVHCTEGKDRTGFICMLLEALAGASYQEIVDDYMITYDNYYEINEEKDKVKYDLILEKNLIPMMYTVVGDESQDLKTIDLSAYARAYLTDIGMTPSQIDALLARITDR